MEFSDLANLFPMMVEEEFQALVKDIRKNGQLTPILIDQERKIVDGRNRWLACQKIGIEAKVKKVDINDNLVNLVVSLNLHRRHLSSSQKAIVAINILPLLQEEAKERQKNAGGDKKSDGYKQTVSVTQQIEEGKKVNGEAAERAAKIVGTNRQYLYDAKRIAEQAPTLIEKIKDGTITIREAKLIMPLNQEQQRNVIERVKQGIDVRTAKRQLVLENTPSVDFPIGKYRIILADCPWSYHNGVPDRVPHPGEIYPLLSTEEICNLAINTISADNAILFLWVPSPLLEEGLKVLRAWGFNYKSSFVWDKQLPNLGYYNSMRHEFLLMATKGSCLPDAEKQFDSVVSVKRTRHSEKPEIFREMIDKMYPVGNRIELFARKKYRNWDSYGNQIEETVNE